jgi:hypothetical protein
MEQFYFMKSAIMPTLKDFSTPAFLYEKGKISYAQSALGKIIAGR